MEFIFGRRHSFAEMVAFGYVNVLLFKEDIGVILFLVLCALIGGIGSILSSAVQK